MAETVKRLQEIMQNCTPIQLQFIAVRPSVKFDHQACKEIGIKPATASRWENKDDVDEAVQLSLQESVEVAKYILGRNLGRAAGELADELEHKNAMIRHKAAIQILDRSLGKPAQSVDVTTKGEALAPAVIILPDNDRNDRD